MEANEAIAEATQAAREVLERNGAVLEAVILHVAVAEDGWLLTVNRQPRSDTLAADTRAALARSLRQSTDELLDPTIKGEGTYVQIPHIRDERVEGTLHLEYKRGDVIDATREGNDEVQRR